MIKDWTREGLKGKRLKERELGDIMEENSMHGEDFS